jgi:hypothetical protein
MPDPQHVATLIIDGDAGDGNARDETTAAATHAVTVATHQRSNGPIDEIAAAVRPVTGRSMTKKQAHFRNTS